MSLSAPTVTAHPPTLAALRWRPFRLPMRHRFEAAHGTLDDRSGVLIELTAEDGVTGVGEASPMPSLGAGTVDDVAALLARYAGRILDGEAEAALSAPAAGVAALRCAIDVALLDIEGRQRALPVSRLLNDESAGAVTVNAVIGGGPPDEVAAYGREASAAGYRVLKLKVGVGGLDEDVARVAALREACPDATIRLDANGAWSEADAAEAIRNFYPLHVELLEQPVAAAAVEAMARIRAAASLRVAADESAADEHGVARVLEAKAADLLVLKPMLLGGLRPALDLARRAAEAGVGCFVTTTFDSSVGTAASLHLAAALPTDAAHGLATGEHMAADVTATPLLPHDGWLHVPDAPGLGVEAGERTLDAVATGAWSEQRA